MDCEQVVHIAPGNAVWRVYRAGYDGELSFEDIGQALDAASALVTDGAAMHIVVHDRPSAPDGDIDSFGVSAAA